MNEIIDRENPEVTAPSGKVYSDRHLWASVFLGGPLAAGYVFAENYKTIGKPEKVKMAWIIAILSTIAILGIAFSIPEDINIPNQLFIGFYMLIGYFLFKRYQAKAVEHHISMGGQKRSWGNAIAVALIACAVTILPIFAIAYSIYSEDVANEITNTYGTSVKSTITFDKRNISEAEIDKIADGFEDIGYLDLYPNSMYIAKKGRTYEISMSVIKDAEKDPDAIAHFTEVRDLLSKVLPRNKIILKLIVDDLENVVKTFE